MIVVGIEDETGTVYGIGEQSPFKLSDSISNMVSDACTPQIEPDISIQTIDRRKTVLIIDIVPESSDLIILRKRKKRLQLYSN